MSCTRARKSTRRSSTSIRSTSVSPSPSVRCSRPPMRTRSKRKSKRTCREAGSFFGIARRKGAFCFCRLWRQAPVWFWKKPASWFNSTPRFLAAQRSAVSRPPRRKIAQRKLLQKGFLWTLSQTKGLRPFSIHGISGFAVFDKSSASYVFWKHSLSGTRPAFTGFLAKMADDLPAEQQIWRRCSPQGIFALQKSLRGGLRWGTGARPRRVSAVPAQRNFQQEICFAPSRGLPSLSYPSTREHSKVRRHA